MTTTFHKIVDLKALPTGQAHSFEGIYLFLRRTTKTARNGNPFLTVELGDKSGSFTTTCFNDSPAFTVFSQIAEGTIIKVRGETDYYQDRLSPKIREVEPITNEDAAHFGVLGDLFETPPESEETLWGFIQDAIAAIQRPVLQATVNHVLTELESAFRTTPAAVSMHHAYRHGLLEHTAHMARACQALLPLYPEVDGDLALAGILLHDVGKIEEYTGGSAPRRSRVGILQGHVVIGFRIVRKAALTQKLDPDLTERLEHIILSHQGELAWGAAAMAATPEAVFVSMIDNLDAKMGMVQRALRNTPPGEPFSDYMAGLQTSLLVEPPKA